MPSSSSTVPGIDYPHAGISQLQEALLDNALIERQSAITAICKIKHCPLCDVAKSSTADEIKILPSKRA